MNENGNTAKYNGNFNRQDRDLLIELRTQVENIRKDIKDLKDGTSKRIECLEKEKADKVIVDAIQKKLDDDFEIRIRCLEKDNSINQGKASQKSVIVAFIISCIGILIGLYGIFK